MEGTEKQASDVDYKIDMAALNQEPQEQKEAPAETQATEGETPEAETQEAAPTAEGDDKQEPVQNEASEEVSEMPVEKTREELFNELLRDKYDIDSNELETVLTKKEDTQELPEDIQKYLEYKKETNRGLEDYLRLQMDYSEVDNAVLLKEYYRQTKNGLDDNDIDALIDLKYGYDDGAEESLIKSKTLEMKEELYKARQFFETQKEKYRKPLESSELPLPENVKKAVEFYQRYTEEQRSQEERQKSVRESFQKKTESFFNDEFKGFEFKIGEDKVVFKPNDIGELKQKQSDLSNFISQHTDENGNLVDAQKYHTALSMAMNPLAYAKFFYEQGKANAIDNVVAEGKNVDMNVRSSVDSSKPQPKFRVLEDDSQWNAGLKFKRR